MKQLIEFIESPAGIFVIGTTLIVIGTIVDLMKLKKKK